MEIKKETIIGMVDGPANIFIKDNSLETEETEGRFLENEKRQDRYEKDE